MDPLRENHSNITITTTIATTTPTTTFNASTSRNASRNLSRIPPSNNYVRKPLENGELTSPTQSCAISLSDSFVSQSASMCFGRQGSYDRSVTIDSFPSVSSSDFETPTNPDIRFRHVSLLISSYLVRLSGIIFFLCLRFSFTLFSMFLSLLILITFFFHFLFSSLHLLILFMSPFFTTIIIIVKTSVIIFVTFFFFLIL